MPEIANVTLEDAKLIWLNFEGKEGQYNAKGNREFTVILDEPTAAALEADGWNVTYIDPRDEEDTRTPKLKVGVRFEPFPPNVVLITSTSRTKLTEDTVETLDGIDIKTVDLIIRPYAWNVGDKSGVKAYLKTMFVTLNEDELERKYAVQEFENQQEA